MSREKQQWTLEDLIDFEQAAAASGGTSPAIRNAVAEAIRGQDGAAARSTGLRVWLEETGTASGGRRFSGALSIVGGVLAVFAFIAGVSAVLGLLDREKGGINVSLFLAILIGGQWLVLILATVGWIFRRKAAGSFSAVQGLAGGLARKLSGDHDDRWWNNLMDGGGAPRAAALWRLARMAQAAGIFFNLGIIVSLAGLVMVRHVGFFWETTTELAMRSLMQQAVDLLSIPWSLWWADAVPQTAVIDSTRWLPGRTTGLAPGPSAWWEFLLMATLVWGLLPRTILWIVSWNAGRRALQTMDFQGRKHRSLWREITGAERVERDEKPLDGVLVLDVGGSGLSEASLRPFLLRQMRVNPAAWQPVSVMDPSDEAKASELLSRAPAGVVLLAEGWSLSPPRMLDLHARIRSSAGPGAPIKFLIANVSPERRPSPASQEERAEWARFVDSLRDPAAEVYFFVDDQFAL